MCMCFQQYVSRNHLHMDVCNQLLSSSKQCLTQSYILHEQVTNKSHTGTDTQFCITVKNTSLLGSCSCSSQISFVGHSFSILQLTFNFFIYLPKLLYNTFELSVHGPLSEAQLYRRTRSSCVSTTCTQNISPKLLSYIKLSLP